MWDESTTNILGVKYLCWVDESGAFVCDNFSLARATKGEGENIDYYVEFGDFYLKPNQQPNRVY